MQPSTEILSTNEYTDASIQDFFKMEQRKVRQMLLSGKPFEAILDALVNTVETLYPGTLCSILILDEEQKCLRHASAPSLPMSYIKTIDGVKIGPVSGSCGTAAYTGYSVIVEDIATNPLWHDFKEQGLAAGLRACWSQPIISADNKVLGTFAIYSKIPRYPSIQEMSLLEMVAELVGIVMEWKKTEHALSASEARWRQLANSKMIGLIHWNLEGDITDANDAFLEMLGYTRQELETGQLHWPDLTPKEYIEADNKVIQRMLAGETISDYVKQLTHKNGHHIDIIAGAEFLPGSTTDAVCFVLNITPQRNAERALQAQQDLIRTIAENTTAALLMIDSKDCISYINPTGETMLGYTLAEIKGKDAHQVFHHSFPDGTPYPESECLLKKTFTTGQSLSAHEDWFIRKDGSFMPVQISAKSISENGHLQGAIVEIRDIRSEKQAKQALIESEERFRSMADQAPILIAMSDVNTELVYFNKAWLDYTGRTMEEEIAFGWVNGIHANEKDNTINSYLAAYQKKTAFETEYRLQRYDGEYRWMYSKVAPRLTPNGEFLGYIGTILDIHDRKQAEEALRESEKRLRGIVETTPECIKIVSYDGTLQYMNKSGLDMAEVDTNALGSFCVFDMIAPEYRDTWIENHRRVCQGESLSWEFDIIGFRGTRRSIETHAVPLPGPDEKPAHLAVSRDITERKRAREDLLIYARKLEASNKELELFATIASHDLQTPLRKVRLFSDAIKSSLGHSIPPETVEYIDRMQRATEKMQNLITDLLDLSRINRKGKPFTKTDLTDIAREARASLLLNIKEVNGQVEIKDLPTIDADSNQMIQLFQNLIENGLKFHQPDMFPIVSVYTEKIADGRCHIVFEDNGVGFDSQYADRIFQIFERLHGEAYSGTGIGLSICKKIAERHHGEIQVQSQKGKGSKFTIILPIQQAYLAEVNSAYSLYSEI